MDQTGAEIAGNATTFGDVRLGRNSSLTLEATDHGAVESAFGFGSEALSFADAASDRALGFGSEALDSVGVLAERQAASSDRQVKEIGRLAEAFQSEGDSENRKLLMYIGGGVLLTVVLVAVVTSRGGKG